MNAVSPGDIATVVLLAVSLVASALATLLALGTYAHLQRTNIVLRDLKLAHIALSQANEAQAFELALLRARVTKKRLFLKDCVSGDNIQEHLFTGTPRG